MAKLTTTQKANYKETKQMMDAQGEYAFLYDREENVSAMAVFTGNMKNHVRIVVSYCGPKDTFKKKLGFLECANKLLGGEGIVMKAVSDSLDYCLRDFMLANYLGD